MGRGFVDGRWVVGFLIVVPIALAIGASLVPRLGPREIMRHQVGEFLAGVLPQPVDWERIEVSLDPPRLTVQGVTAGVASNGEPLLRAETIALEVEEDALRRGMVELREVVVDGMVLRLEWSGEEWRWIEDDLPATSAPEVASDASDPGSTPSENRNSPRWTIVRSRVWIVDRAVEPPREFAFSGVEAEVQPTRDGADVSGSGSFLGGSFRGNARVSESREVSGVLDVEEIDLAPFRPYAPPVSRASGLVSGTFKLDAKTPSDWLAKCDLALRDADLQIKDLDLKGDLQLEVTVRPTKQGRADGDFRIVASDAALDMGGVYKKPPGKPADVSGDFQVEAGRKVKIGSFRLSIGNLDAGRP
ncbi:MAG: hypothetical protein VX574_09365 [Myxococcota bacterium]|nr:hypothetical protein [Myxococcota bacterium]